MLKFLRIDASVTWHHHLIVLLWTNFFPAGNCLLKVNNVNFEHVVASWVEIITTYKILFLIQALTYSKSLTSCCTLVSCTWWKQVRFNIHIRTMDFTGPNFTNFSVNNTTTLGDVIVSLYLTFEILFFGKFWECTKWMTPLVN